VLRVVLPPPPLLAGCFSPRDTPASNEDDEEDAGGGATRGEDPTDGEESAPIPRFAAAEESRFKIPPPFLAFSVDNDDEEEDEDEDASLLRLEPCEEADSDFAEDDDTEIGPRGAAREIPAMKASSRACDLRSRGQGDAVVGEDEEAEDESAATAIL
jgi:hypothetical protein